MWAFHNFKLSAIRIQFNTNKLKNKVKTPFFLFSGITVLVLFSFCLVYKYKVRVFAIPFI